MSSSVILSSCVLRDVAWRDLEALALKRAMKVCSSLIWSDFFLLASWRWRRAIWLVSYQKV
jgi:hypothetical protein